VPVRCFGNLPTPLSAFATKSGSYPRAGQAAGQRGMANPQLQPTAAAILDWRSCLSLSAAAAAGLGCLTTRSHNGWQSRLLD
jgi:hypothetical protein